MTTLIHPASRPTDSREDQRRAWDRDGFLVVRDFFPAAQIANAAAEADELLVRHRALMDVNNLRCRFQANVVTGDQQFECFDPVIDLSLACHLLALDSRLLALIGTLYGEEACLFKDKIVYKPPGLKGYEVHQDYPPWPSFPRSFLTVLIPFDRVDEDNGCTIVYEGYHVNGLMSPSDRFYYPMPDGLVDEARAVPLVLEPGDIALFTGFTPHRSAPNRSSRWRRQFFPSYNRLSDGGHQRPQHYEEFQQRMRERHLQGGNTGVYYS
jgi:ectoine hydroxylase-related dioxygenase (phytanoyl-CoA dioxygenase family)